MKFALYNLLYDRRGHPVERNKEFQTEEKNLLSLINQIENRDLKNILRDSYSEISHMFNKFYSEECDYYLNYGIVSGIEIQKFKKLMNLLPPLD